jgi:enamine deaminase RidA (YjgF/YER057c/UK114 family)
VSGAEARLRELGVELPAPPRPLGAYVPLVVAGDLAFLSGMVPVVEGVPRFVGQLGRGLGVDEGREAARLATRNALAIVRAELGSLDRVDRAVRLAAYLNAAEGFTEHPRVADAASQLLAEVFGAERGHTRLVYGVTSLPLGMCIELELILALRPAR